MARSFSRLCRCASPFLVEGCFSAQPAGFWAHSGRDKSGEELPQWVADKKKRAKKIRAAKAELEAEAKAAAAAAAQAPRGHPF